MGRDFLRTDFPACEPGFARVVLPALHIQRLSVMNELVRDDTSSADLLLYASSRCGDPLCEGELDFIRQFPNAKLQTIDYRLSTIKYDKRFGLISNSYLITQSS